MREPKPEWVAALRALDGCAQADIRFNPAVGRWEFLLPGADQVVRSQFWCWFRDPQTNAPIPPDPVTGLGPFRELDDDAMREALHNLEVSFVGNRHDGAGSARKEVLRRVRFNRDLQQAKYRAAGEAFADLAAERARRLRGAPLIHVPVHLGR